MGAITKKFEEKNITESKCHIPRTRPYAFTIILYLLKQDWINSRENDVQNGSRVKRKLQLDRGQNRFTFVEFMIVIYDSFMIVYDSLITHAPACEIFVVFTTIVEH